MPILDRVALHNLYCNKQYPLLQLTCGVPICLAPVDLPLGTHKQVSHANVWILQKNKSLPAELDMRSNCRGLLPKRILYTLNFAWDHEKLRCHSMRFWLRQLNILSAQSLVHEQCHEDFHNPREPEHAKDTF